jgi:hypothetical protein
VREGIEPMMGEENRLALALAETVKMSKGVLF